MSILIVSLIFVVPATHCAFAQISSNPIFDIPGYSSSVINPVFDRVPDPILQSFPPALQPYITKYFTANAYHFTRYPELELVAFGEMDPLEYALNPWRLYRYVPSIPEAAQNLLLQVSSPSLNQFNMVPYYRLGVSFLTNPDVPFLSDFPQFDYHNQPSVPAIPFSSQYYTSPAYLFTPLT